MVDLARFTFHAMGSACALHLPAGEVAAAEAAEAEVRRIEQRYSRYRDDSVLAAINRAAASGETIEVDAETAALVDFAVACHRKSGGLFDLTTGILRRAWNFSSGRAPAPEEIARWLPFVGWAKVRWERPHLSFRFPGVELDFGGLGKEYAADCAAAVCAGLGLAHGLIDLGGDLCAIGPRPDGTPWPIHLRDPRAPGQALAMVPLASGGLATSGDYERFVLIDGQRYGHILHPHTGWPVRGLAGVSVVAPTCLLAGSVATIAMLKGSDGPAWLTALGVACAWVDCDGRTGGSLLPPSRPPGDNGPASSHQV